MQNDSWFKSWFSSPDYLKLYEHRDTRDAKRIVTLLFKNIKLPKGAIILDLACGNGRHSILFARKGFNTTGLDLSRFLISQAKKKLKNEFKGQSGNLRFEIKDMRNIGHKNEFDLVVNLFTSFGYFKTDKDNEKVISSVSKALKPGGFFFFDYLNSTFLRKNVIPFDIKKFNGKSAIQMRSVDNKYITKDIYILSERKPNHYYPGIFHFTERIRLYSLADFRTIFRKNKLKMVRTFGDYSGSSFNEKKSKRLIILAQKV